MPQPTMTHKKFAASLSATTRTALHAKSNLRGIFHLTAHVGLILLAGALIAARIPFWPLLLPIDGILIIFLFCCVHECTHKTPFRSPWLNESVGRAASVLIFLPFSWFRYFHLAHHKHTNDPAKDPELVGVPKPRTRAQYVWHVTGIGIWIAQGKTLIRNAFGRGAEAFVPTRARLPVRIESIILLLFYALIAVYSFFGSTALVMLWVVPVLLGQPFLRLYLLAEHGRCPTVANMLLNSRTLETNRIVRFLAWNMPFHAEHHSLPNVPFYRLPDLHGLIRAHLGATSKGYIAFHKDYIGALDQRAPSAEE